MFLSREQLRQQLIRSGHELNTDRESSTCVEPPPTTIATVGANLDPCQWKTHRERYFAMLLDDGSRPMIRAHPNFTPTGAFAAALNFEPLGGRYIGGNFRLGPARWLIQRLARMPRIFLCPEDQIRTSDNFVREHWALEEMPRLRDWLREVGTVPVDAGAIALNTSAVGDCRVIWEVVAQVEAGFFNFFISDPQTEEVYELHHHSKVTASVPDPGGRQRLVDELAAYPDVLEDCSASLLDWGDERLDEEEDDDS